MSSPAEQVARTNALLRGYRDRCKMLYGDGYPAMIGRFQAMLEQAREKFGGSDQEALIKLSASMAAQGTPFSDQMKMHFGAAIVENSEGEWL